MINAADFAWMTDIVTSSLDVTVTRYRDVRSADGYGHSSITPDTVGLAVACNIITPSATQLQAYGGIIAGQVALMIRVMQSADVVEGDRIRYDGKDWIVQPIQNAESYTVTKEFLITAVV